MLAFLFYPNNVSEEGKGNRRRHSTVRHCRLKPHGHGQRNREPEREREKFRLSSVGLCSSLTSCTFCLCVFSVCQWGFQALSPEVNSVKSPCSLPLVSLFLYCLPLLHTPVVFHSFLRPQHELPSYLDCTLCCTTLILPFSTHPKPFSCSTARTFPHSCLYLFSLKARCTPVCHLIIIVRILCQLCELSAMSLYFSTLCSYATANISLHPTYCKPCPINSSFCDMFSIFFIFMSVFFTHMLSSLPFQPSSPHMSHPAVQESPIPSTPMPVFSFYTPVITPSFTELLTL